jgi:hypothetical protein
MIPYSYKKPESYCKECKHCFIREEHDESNRYYCTFGDKESRPSCGSYYMSESWGWPYRDKLELWEEWSEQRQVAPMGTCDKFCARGEKT